jgi:PAS domain S-box-containing protein
MNILSVHHHSQVHQQVEGLLKTHGHTVNTAHHGKEALSRLQDEHFDGIISDGYLPEMDGFQLCRAVKLHGSFKRIPFVFLITVYDEKDEAFAINLGASGIFSPSDPQKILPRTEKAFQTPCEPGDILEENAYLREHDTRIKKLLDKTLQETEKIREELSQSEIKYQNLFEGSHDATFIMDAKGGHIEANKKASELLGYTLDEFRKLSFREIIVPSAVPDSEQKLEMMLRGENTPIYEKNLRAKDGRIIPVEISVSGVRNSSGRIANIQSIVRDITERKKAEQALRESEEKYRNLVEQANDGIATIQGGLLKYVNPRWVDMTGYSVEESLHTPATDYVYSERICDILDHDRISDDSSPTPLHEAVLRRKNGDTLYIEVNAGRTICQGHSAVLMIMRDITEKKQAQGALQKSEQGYKDLFENAPLGIYRTTPDGRILMANPALVRMLGYDSFEELFQRNLEEDGFEAGYPRPVVKEKLEREGQIAGMEFIWRRKDGTALFFRENAKSVRDNGNILYYEGTMEDITEWKQAEIQLRESEERYRNIVELAPDGIITANLMGVITSCNTAFLNISGYSRDEIVGKHISRLPTIRAKDLPTYVKLFSSLMRGKMSAPFEFAWVHKDGSTRWGEIHTSLMKKDGKIGGVQAVTRDITERKKAEEQLRESEERYRNIVELAPDGIATLDLKGVVTSCNTAFLTLTGYTADEIVGKHISRLPTVRARDIPSYLKMFGSFIRGKLSLPIEFKWIHKNGDIRWGEVHATRIKKGRKTVGVQIITRDVTERKQAEKQLRESEERYRNIVELAPNGIITVDVKGFITSCNTAFLNISGYSEEEIVGKHFTKSPTVRARDVSQFVKIFSSLIRGKISKPIEFTWVHRDGGTRLGEVYVALMRKGRHLIGLQAMLLDITERKRTEEMLQLSEEKYRSLVGNLNIGVYRSTPGKDGKFIDVNQAFADMLGHKRDELIDLKVSSIYVDPQERMRFNEKMVVEGAVKNEELRLKKKNGIPVIVSDTSTAVYDTDGTLLHFDGVTEDITRRKETEEELKKYRTHLEELVEQRTTNLKKTNQQLQREIAERFQVEESLAAEKERLAVTLRSIGDGVITTDTAGEVVLINKVAEQLTGYTQKEAAGRPLHEIFNTINEETRTPCENPVAEVLNQGFLVNPDRDVLLIAKDGTEKIVAESGAPIRDRNSRIIGVVLVFRDVTERQKMEQDLLRAQKLESLGILAGGIAHDFNNILTAIVDNVALARLHTQENRVVEKLTKVEKASLQAKNLTQQLLTFSRGGAPIKKVTVITELIKDSTSFALRGSKVRCRFDIPDDLWPANIDEGQINQVINNLVINADQAMPEGGSIQVHAENTTVTPQDQLPVHPGKYIQISISDEGIGIPERYLSKIFDPYFTTKQKGSGLGLATSYSIVNRHNGHIDAASQVGKGTTFYVWLPASFELTELQVVEPSGYMEGKGRVLLMDDEDIILEAAGDVLQHLGYHVECARDGAEAVVLYKKARAGGIPFDVVIMDLTIPGGMGGEEAIKELKKVDPHVQAIVSSGYSNDPVMADYREYGFCDVVTKPYTLEELSETVRRVLNGKDP